MRVYPAVMPFPPPGVPPGFALLSATLSILTILIRSGELSAKANGIEDITNAAMTAIANSLVMVFMNASLDNAALIRMKNKLDRVLYRNDAVVEVVVDIADHRSQGSRLAVACGTADKNQAIRRLCDVP